VNDVKGLIIAVPIWAVTVAVCLAYLRAVDRLFAHMKQFYGAAWVRLNRRFPFRNASPLVVYARPRKTGTILEMLWCWRRPLRHPDFAELIGEARRFAIITALSIALSVVVFVVFDSPFR